MWQAKLAICTTLLFYTASCHSTEGTEDTDLVVPDPIISQGLQWLWRHREPDYSFKDVTARAVTTLQLANTSQWYSNDNIYSLTTVKQMEIELLLQLSRHRETSVVPAEIAEYCLALIALCKDPRQFHSYDLIGILLHHDLLLDWELSVGSLAVCTSGAHVRKRQLRRLLDATEAHEALPMETLSMVMIALNCIVHDHRNRNLQHYLLPPSKAMGKLQKNDGSFGSLKTTACVIQALQASDPGGHYWNKSAAISFLRAKQKDDGSFGDDGDIETTMAALLALGPRSLANIKDLSCRPEKSDDWSSMHLIDLAMSLNFSMGNHIHQEENRSTEQIGNTSASTTTTTVAPPARSLGSMNAVVATTAEAKVESGVVTVSYTLWIGSNATSAKTLNISTEPGANFYHVMQIAAEQDPYFGFESTEWPNGHYIHTLANCKEEPMTYHYWLLYRLPSLPTMDNPPSNQYVAPFGVDDLIVHNKDIYLFWFKKL